ncbi:MarR family winged helix-turn-helix transcriptional regulator [Albidovulum sp.]|uniref:MarR family winged helix-turn-helix transcriptional regulator n=1 Tax=Albidovulum sp. TaxID=1872424 RepID=UPI0039B9448B
MSGQADQIAFALDRLSALRRAGRWRAGADFGLNPTQGEILSRIAVRPERAAELAAHFGVTPASMSDSVSSLVAKGFAAREPDPADRRAQRVAPSAKGREAARQLATAPDAVTAAIHALPGRDRAALLAALVRLIRGLQEARAIPVQRMCLTCRHFRPNVHDDAARPHHCAFVGVAFGDADLRLDCGDHEPAPAGEAAANRRRFDAA